MRPDSDDRTGCDLPAGRYSTAGSLSDSGYDEEHRLTVWTASGRDQSEIIQRLSDDSFTPESGYKVDLRLVASNALLPNILAGTPIDVYLTAAASDPVNYAIRGAVVDLTEFADLEEVVSQFHPAALVPFTYQDHVYALPESLNFPVLFYRKDVFAQYGLEVPTTWSEFYENVSLLQKNRMTVGFNWTQAFSIFLYQSGGQYYNGEGTASALDSNEGMRAFQRVAELYTTYGLPVQFDFANRFRSGEMPMGIVDYNMYNQLTVFAPEIKGLWAFAPLPGTQDENGEINNVSPCTGNAAIMPRCVSNKEGAWEFLKWWTGAEAQTRYGIEMETVLGPSAKQPSANLEAVANLPWDCAEFNTLKTQWDHLAGTPEIPGSYYTARSLDFAFNSVYSLGQDAIEALEENVLLINEEIQRKLKEFDKAH